MMRNPELLHHLIGRSMPVTFPRRPRVANLPIAIFFEIRIFVRSGVNPDSSDNWTSLQNRH